jgi:hypothetical protein
MATFQVLGPDVVNAIVKTSGTQVKLPLGSRITIGGQQYANSADLFVNTGSTGAGGLDTGSLGVHQVWYIHAIVNVGALALVASQSKTAPTGFTTFTWTGWIFFTDDSSQVALTANSTRWNTISYTPTMSGFVIGNGTINGTMTRVDDRAILNIDVIFGSSSTFGAGASVQLSTPSGISMDSAKVPSASQVLTQGSALGFVSGNANFAGVPLYLDTTHFTVVGPSTADVWNNVRPGSWNTSSYLSIIVNVPISGWSANIL